MFVAGWEVFAGTVVGCDVGGGVAATGSVLADGTGDVGWGAGSAAAVVAVDCCVSREIVGDVWAAGLFGVRTAGATGAALATVE